MKKDIPDVPEDVLVTELHDKRNSMEYWYPRLNELDVNTPKTKFFDLEPREDEFPEFNVSGIIQYMKENDWQRAFVRSMYKSAQLNIDSGSFIHKPSPPVIKLTIYELLTQHAMMEMPTGGRLAIREYLDLKHCIYSSEKPHHSHKHEIRYFIKDGEILYSFPSVDEIIDESLECDGTFKPMEELVDEGIEPPDEQAQVVAKEFTEESWHVDFVLPLTGEWYCVDMGLNGIYWNEREQKWKNISAHKHGSEYNLQEQYTDYEDEEQTDEEIDELEGLLEDE